MIMSAIELGIIIAIGALTWEAVSAPRTTLRLQSPAESDDSSPLGLLNGDVPPARKVDLGLPLFLKIIELCLWLFTPVVAMFFFKVPVELKGYIIPFLVGIFCCSLVMATLSKSLVLDAVSRGTHRLKKLQTSTLNANENPPPLERLNELLTEYGILRRLPYYIMLLAWSSMNFQYSYSIYIFLAGMIVSALLYASGINTIHRKLQFLSSEEEKPHRGPAPQLSS